MSGKRAPASIAELVRAQSERAPDAVALAGLHGVPLTYSALSERLELVERELRSTGIGPEDRVAVVLDDGPDLAVTFLALAAAAACAPLNPAYREQELEFYLSDLGATAVVVRAGAASPARAVAERLGLVLLELEERDGPAGTFSLRAHGRARTSAKDDRREAALLLHTSGTPKKAAWT